MKYYDKIDLQSLESDLEKYGIMKHTLEQFRINIVIKMMLRNSLKLEIDSLRQEKERLEKSINIMQAKTTKIIDLLARAITRAVTCGVGNISNISSTIFSVDTQVTLLSNILQRVDDGKTTTTKKMKKYNSDGKIVED
jgi:hypothetical protein